MQKIAILLGVILVAASLSGCLDSNESSDGGENTDAINQDLDNTELNDENVDQNLDNDTEGQGNEDVLPDGGDENQGNESTVPDGGDENQGNESIDPDNGSQTPDDGDDDQQTPDDPINSNNRVNIYDQNWSTLIQDCDDNLNPSVWQASGVNALFEALDYDNSSDVSYCEIFVKIDHQLMPYSNDYAMHRWTSSKSDSFTWEALDDVERFSSSISNELQDAFENADVDEDQHIDGSEIDAFLLEMFDIYFPDGNSNYDNYVEYSIDSIRDGILPLADVGDDGVLNFAEFTEYYLLGDEYYYFDVYIFHSELSNTFEYALAYSPYELFNVTDTDQNGIITVDDFIYLGTDFEGDQDFYWDICEWQPEQNEYMCWMSDWELDDDGEGFSECEEVSPGQWYCDGGATDEDDDEDDDEDNDEDENTPSISAQDWHIFSYGYCEWEGNQSSDVNDVWWCMSDSSDNEWHSEWHYCVLHGFDWHCTNFFGPIEEDRNSYYYYDLWRSYMFDFEEEYIENIFSKIFYCASGDDDFVDIEEFTQLYYLMLIDDSNLASFCVLDVDGDMNLTVSEIVSSTNQASIYWYGIQAIGDFNFDVLTNIFSQFDVDESNSLDYSEYTESKYWKSMGYIDYSNGFICGDGTVISQSYVNDGIVDCSDGSDESSDEDDTFVCNNGEEIPASWVNDGEDDCSDGSDENYDPYVIRVSLSPCGHENDGVCIGLECGFPEFSTLDNNSNGTLNISEFVLGLKEFDDRYSYDYLINIFEYLTGYEDDAAVNESLYSIMDFGEFDRICFGLECTIPQFTELDSNADGMLDRGEFVNGLSEADPRYSDQYSDMFNETSGSDQLLDKNEYDEFTEQLNFYSYPDEGVINHSEADLNFSKVSPRCWHIQFFDGTNPDFSNWGGSVQFTDSNGVVSTIEDFSHYLSFVSLNESLTWTIEYTFDEDDVGFIIDGVTYEGGNFGGEGTIVLTFTE